MRPIPVVSMEEVIAQLTERGKMEWEMATAKAQLVRALNDHMETPPVELPVESGHKELTTPE